MKRQHHVTGVPANAGSSNHHAPDVPPVGSIPTVTPRQMRARAAILAKRSPQTNASPPAKKTKRSPASFGGIHSSTTASPLGKPPSAPSNLGCHPKSVRRGKKTPGSLQHPINESSGEVQSQVPPTCESSVSVDQAKANICQPLYPSTVISSNNGPLLTHTACQDPATVAPNGEVQSQVTSIVDHGNGESSLPINQTNVCQPLYPYEDLGDCEEVCEFCNARFWFVERLTSYPSKERPRYNLCCRGGKVKLRFPVQPPHSLRVLFDQKSFLLNIRRYNAMFAMTSFGATIDDSINNGTSPYVFKVSGQITHWLGSISPPSLGPVSSPSSKPRFLQLYIYDTMNEVTNRLSIFSGKERNPLSADVVRVLIDTLDECNALVKLFRTARDLCLGTNPPEFSIRLYQSVQRHPYELPTDGTIGAIIQDGQPDARDFDIIIRNKEGFPQRVTNLHPSYMSLQYPLLFPYGEEGWATDFRYAHDVSMRQFYCYQMHDRLSTYTLLLQGGRLFQQYLVDAYICIERDRLDYIALNQNNLRVEFLSGIHDAICKGDTEGNSIGKRVFLPASFTGSPRYMYKHYLDALAICSVHGNPQYFITFTCNAKWPEITRHLQAFPTLLAQDRPDIIARVFKMKVESFITFLKVAKPFGSVAAELYTIEFQKRGLPHCHTLLWVKEPYKITSAADVDKYISAEIPDKNREPALHKVVTELMIHGPCGIANKKAPCMRDDLCKKKFPRHHERVTRFDSEGRVYYKRPPGGPSVMKGDISVDNSFVVPYNKHLCTRFNAHINVEYCGWSMMIKYLFKYISKGADRIRYSITSPPSSNNPSSSQPSSSNAPSSKNDQTLDEIKNFVDGRFVCPHEAAWRILKFPIHHRSPAVYVLAVHLEGRQNVTFQAKRKLKDIVNNPKARRTTLTEWLRQNSIDPSGRHLKYIQYLAEYRWDLGSKTWKRRSSDRQSSIGRLAYVHPSSGESFYLRLLLNHQRGCMSFDDIKTISSVVCPTYRSACEKLGLIGDDREWVTAFKEAAGWATARDLRLLFSHMLLFCDISDPLRLWNKIWQCMSDDIVHGLCNTIDTTSDCVPPTEIQQHVLFEIEKLLNSNSTSATLADYGLPMPNAALLQQLTNRLLMEEKCYDRVFLRSENERLHAGLQPKQLEVYNLVIESVAEDKQIMLFIYGHGGTGKTYLWNTIISGLRADGKVVLAVAASGIASLLLPSGRTAHSRFKIPIDLTDESLCDIKKNTQLAQLLAETTIIIWDEAPMSDRRCFESLDKTLKDLMNNDSLPFGGKSILLGGDFRQTLPVRPKGSKSEIIASSLPMSYLWPNFRVIKLTENMRLHRQGLSSSEKESVDMFSKWLLQIGDGSLGTATSSTCADCKVIDIPNQYLLPPSDNQLLGLIDFIYDSHTIAYPTAENLSDKAIVCPKNETANNINNSILAMSPGDSTKYMSADSITARFTDRGDTEMLYPLEYLNRLSFPGLPSHTLELKVNTPVMLLRNINPAYGLCNGTRLLITQVSTCVVEAEIITGTSIGTRVYIPRICFIHDDKELPFVFRRRQFPLKVCYAMTINKSQGQSLNKIGVYLPEPVFAHGQLYVAFSRATSPSALKVVLSPSNEKPLTSTHNIVYTEYLTEILGSAG